MNISKAKILIIDDNEDIITMVKMMLEMKGYDVTIKMNTAQIEDVIMEIKPELIIMDMLLSGADGRLICEALKNNDDLVVVPILMMSAHPNARVDCLKAGANGFIEKPFEIQNFYDAVEKTLSLK
jgi:DNA-binding response OmpR family regulator